MDGVDPPPGFGRVMLVWRPYVDFREDRLPVLGATTVVWVLGSLLLLGADGISGLTIGIVVAFLLGCLGVYALITDRRLYVAAGEDWLLAWRRPRGARSTGPDVQARRASAATPLGEVCDVRIERRTQGAGVTRKTTVKVRMATAGGRAWAYELGWLQASPPLRATLRGVLDRPGVTVDGEVRRLLAEPLGRAEPQGRTTVRRR